MLPEECQCEKINAAVMPIDNYCESVINTIRDCECLIKYSFQYFGVGNVVGVANTLYTFQFFLQIKTGCFQSA